MIGVVPPKPAKTKKNQKPEEACKITFWAYFTLMIFWNSYSFRNYDHFLLFEYSTTNSTPKIRKKFINPQEACKIYFTLHFLLKFSHT